MPIFRDALNDLLFVVVSAAAAASREAVVGVQIDALVGGLNRTFGRSWGHVALDVIRRSLEQSMTPAASLLLNVVYDVERRGSTSGEAKKAMAIEAAAALGAAVVSGGTAAATPAGSSGDLLAQVAVSSGAATASPVAAAAAKGVRLDLTSPPVREAMLELGAVVAALK
jgi:hypothetical protein